MTKKLSYKFLIIALALITLCPALPAKAAADHSGKLVKMDGLSTIYYVASNGKRYVFPSVNIYNSWFTDFNSIETLSSDELSSLPLGGNVLYRPGALLVKITTDPKVYAVSKNGQLRWITSETIAKALYGDNWNALIDDVADSFFTNYQVGTAINNSTDFDPEDELENNDSIDTNFGFSNNGGKKAQTVKCHIANFKRFCTTAHNGNNNATGTNTEAPYITNITATNYGETGYVDTKDKIVITFSEAINPASVRSNLTAGSYTSSLETNLTGAININSDGLLTIKNIAKFDLGTVKTAGDFPVKLELSDDAKKLSLTIIAGQKLEIKNEKFAKADQIGGTIKDAGNKAMETKTGLDVPSGTFGGKNEGDKLDPTITSIKVYNGDSTEHIDVNDKIVITFSEELNPTSINANLKLDSFVENVDSTKTGGVTIDEDGIVTITNIAKFTAGDVTDSGKFDVKLALDSDGKKLTITLTNGYDLKLYGEDLDLAEQIGDFIEDTDGNEMDEDKTIGDPDGSFLSSSLGGVVSISKIEVRDGGLTGYIDTGDKIIITFSNKIGSRTINVKAGETRSYLEAYETGGVHIDANGILSVSDIASFDVGTVSKASEFETNIALDSTGKILTITLSEGEKVEIKTEDFSNTTQIGGFIENEDGDAMDDASNITDPKGTFGEGSGETAPYIVSIKVTNKGAVKVVDVKDEILVTFNEKINPDSIDNDLNFGSFIENVDDDNAGGISVDSDGIMTIAKIAKFYIGEVENDETYKVKLSLNSDGNELTIKITSGDSATITDQDLDNAEQLDGTIEDYDDEKMEYDSRIDDPSGSF